MTVLSLIAATFSFTATATGIAKGTPVEFAFAGAGSDRDYEAMFLLEESVEDFCARLEKAGLPRGKPEDVRSCTLWPVGCVIDIKPSLRDYIESMLPDGKTLAPVVYTGGSRLPSGICEAATNMPLAVLSYYSLAQSPLAFAEHYSQSAVYNCHLAGKTLKKGERVRFTLSWDEKTMPRPLSILIEPGKSAEVFNSLKEASKSDELDVLVDFSPDLTVREAVAVANALSVIDSRRVKINGCRAGHLFYRAFLPAVKWLDRQERMVQPFEYTLGDTNRLVYVESDWSGEGMDPKLTPCAITTADAKRKTDTDTCFLYVKPDMKLSRLYDAVSSLAGSSVRTWYVYAQE